MQAIFENVEKIKRNWKRPGNFNVCFCKMFDH